MNNKLGPLLGAGLMLMAVLVLGAAAIKYRGDFSGTFTGNASGLTNLPTIYSTLTVTNLTVQPTNGGGSTWLLGVNTNTGDVVLPDGTAGLNSHLEVESNLTVKGTINASATATIATTNGSDVVWLHFTNGLFYGATTNTP